jgi:DNA modification methylase
MTAAILRGDARNIPLPDASVDLICTSPPYYSLRSYRDGGEHYDGQIGAEPTPAEYVAALLECTREWMRVLKPEGSLWLNLGDKYAGAPSGPRETLPHDTCERSHVEQWRSRRHGQRAGVPTKSLIGLPWRYALGCIDDLGLILRAEVIWSKPNGLPESVTDRVRRSHEQWFHLVKQPRYFSAVDEIREAHTWGRQINPNWSQARRKHEEASQPNPRGNTLATSHPLGKLPVSVWEIATQPLKVPAELAVDHFAAFPMEWPRRIISGWSPSGICTACGEGRRPVADVQKTYAPRPSHITALTNAHGSDGREGARPSSVATITGYACACADAAAPTRPAVVLDPFGGTGTTVLVADVLGRHGISVDRSADYCRLARWRTTDSGERARVLGVPKPPKPMDGQGDLFEAAS